ncbi:related to Translation machinery-associated protein 22 [Ustilago trichophora]|uniref:Translation machinery-associated protein 22 n=1 Tax=Ustilago trichophora TaxID=86804 RepID=A0A5C3E1G1_9BASI|nr:related to Translation machinery-associated protein 22 [Ustilago trichophora]
MADIENSEAGPSVPTGPQPREVVYCAVCTFPPEYCEFGPSPSKCRSWLKDNQPELYSKLWSEEAISSNLANLTTKQAEDLEREAAKKERKTVAKEERARAEMAASRIVLKKEARTKRKVTTSIIGLHLFSPPLPALKVVAKALSSRFATGASVSKSVQNPGVDEIVVQGDVADDVRDLILARTKPFHELPNEADGGPSEKNIVIEEDKKTAKKSAAAASGAAAPTDD